MIKIEVGSSSSSDVCIGNVWGNKKYPFATFCSEHDKKEVAEFLTDIRKLSSEDFSILIDGGHIGQ